MAMTIFRMFLHVGDQAEGTRFYQTLLGVEPTPVGGGRFYFQLDTIVLSLMAKPAAELKTVPEYVYFAVSDVEAVFARAKEMNVLATEIVHGVPAADLVKRPWGERSFYARDPWGNGLCFVDETTLFTGKR